MLLFDRCKRKEIFFDLSEISDVLQIFFHWELAKTHEKYGFIGRLTEKLPFKVQW